MSVTVASRAEFARRHAVVRQARFELAVAWQRLIDLKRAREHDQAAIGAAELGHDIALVSARSASFAVLDRAIADQRAEVARRGLAAHRAEQHRDEVWDDDFELGGGAAA